MGEAVAAAPCETAPTLGASEGERGTGPRSAVPQNEGDLRCRSCSRFLAYASGLGPVRVRIPCPKCKTNNVWRFEKPWTGTAPRPKSRYAAGGAPPAPPGRSDEAQSNGGV